MGLHFDEINPLAGLSREKTRNAASALWEAGQHTREGPDSPRMLPGSIIAQIMTAYPLSNGLAAVPHLMRAGWLSKPDRITGKYGLAGCIGDIAKASTLPRMNVAEASAKIREMRARLDTAPTSINGIHLRQIFAFGSAIRDQNRCASIGDIDLAGEFVFDQRYDSVNAATRFHKAAAAWGALISGGDERLSVGDAGAIAPEIVYHVATERGHLRRGKSPTAVPMVILSAWQSAQPQPSALSPLQLQAFAELQSRTLATNQRARDIQLRSDEKVAPSARIARTAPPLRGPST